MVSRKSAPYTGTYANAATKHPAQGPTVEALKRALARLGYMAWKGKDFTQVWPAGGELDKAFRQWERSRDMPGDGVYSEQEWKQLRGARIPDGPKKGQPALDAYACRLIREDWASQNVPDEQDARAAITKFCTLAERNEDAWHYALVRPLDASVEPTARYLVSDCSMYSIQSYNYAARTSGLAVPDPGGFNYQGYGNTDSMEGQGHPRVTDGVYRVGDLAMYPGHVTICRKAGSSTTAIFSSHGQEAGPIPTSIFYRRDFLHVLRPPLR